MRNSGFRCSPSFRLISFRSSSSPMDFAVISTALTGGLGCTMYKVGAMGVHVINARARLIFTLLKTLDHCEVTHKLSTPLDGTLPVTHLGGTHDCLVSAVRVYSRMNQLVWFVR